MARGQSVRRVNRPVAAVWAVLANHRGMAEWFPGVSVTLEQFGSPTADGVGAVRAFQGPAGVRIREEITAFEPERELSYRALSGVPLPDYAGTVELAEQAGQTTVRWSLTSSTPLPGANIALDLIARALLFALLHRLASTELS